MMYKVAHLTITNGSINIANMNNVLNVFMENLLRQVIHCTIQVVEIWEAQLNLENLLKLLMYL
jgi:hypothetical protein